jgi:hypoxanthine phosphoribosyltransferase
MMKTVTIKDKEFAVSISAEKIQEAVDNIAEQINWDLAGKDPLFLVVLNGAFMFAADLMRHVTIPCEITFIKLSSYEGTQSTGVVKEIFGLNESVAGRTVVVVEDIVDTGITMERIVNSLREKGAADIRVATFFLKPDSLKRQVPLNYVALKIPNQFIVGYGLDYDGYGRNLKEIYTLIPKKNP